MVGLSEARTTGLERYGLELISSLRRYTSEDWQIVPFVHPWAAEVLGGDCVVVPEKMPRPAALEAWLPVAAKRAGIALMHGTGFGVPTQTPTPIVLTVQDLISWEIPDSLTRGNRLYFRPLMERSIRSRRLAGVVATSETTARGFGMRFPARVPVKIARIGIGDWWFETEGSARPERDGGVRILTVGTLEPRKGLQRMVRACEILDDAGVLYEWRHVGRSGWGDMQLPPRIELLGVLSDELLRAEYDRADLLVSASTQEGFNLPALEGTARGCRLVLSDLPVHRELFSRVATYFSLSGMDSLGRTLLETAAPTVAQRERSKAVATEFSWSEACVSISSLWRGIL